MSAAHYEARKLPDGRHIVLEHPTMRWIEERPTLEAAQAYALALNEWVDRKPDPTIVTPFFVVPPALLFLDLEERARPERLDEILDAMLEPEERADAISDGMAARREAA